MASVLLSAYLMFSGNSGPGGAGIGSIISVECIYIRFSGIPGQGGAGMGSIVCL